MSNFMYAFMLSTLAGLSTLIGFIPVLLHLKNEKTIILTSLAFASGVMICVSLTDLIPESFQLLTSIFKGFPALLFLLIFICIGVIASMLIDKFLPKNDNKTITNKKLYRLGLVSMLAIIMHNIPEGIATFLSSTTNSRLGLSLALAISFHNIPEGISIAIPIYFSTKSKRKAFFYTLLSGLSEPLGALIAYLFLANHINNFMMSIIFAIIAGIMMHISIYELLNESLQYKNKLLTFLFVVIGFLFMMVSHFLFS